MFKNKYQELKLDTDYLEIKKEIKDFTNKINDNVDKYNLLFDSFKKKTNTFPFNLMKNFVKIW